MRRVLVLFAVCAGFVGAQPVRIACGNGTDYTASDGKVWQHDQYFTGGARRNVSYSVNNSPDPMLYRWSRDSYYGDFSYSVPVTNGAYKLTLRFAESQFTVIGSRVFNVSVNGTAVLTNFDLARDAGFLTAIDKQFPVVVTNGLVNIQVSGIQNGGTLNAFAIEADTVSPPALQVSSSSLTFTANQGGANPSSQSVNVTNGGGGGTIAWAATKTASWVTLGTASGTTPGPLAIGANISGLTPGTYTDTVTISSSAGTQPVAITLQVNPPVSVGFVRLDTTTKGNWKSAYGGDGYNFVGETPSVPAYAQLQVSGASSFTWSPSTSDTRALQQVNGASGVAATWYAANIFTFDLNFTDGGTHQVALYADDFDNSNRSQKIDILDSASSALLDSRTMSAFSQGQYLVWNLAGHVVIRVTRLGGTNAVVSGLFFGGPFAAPVQPVLSVSGGPLTFTAGQGGANPAAQSVSIANTGAGTLNWTASKTQSWLNLPVTSGTAPSSLSVGVLTGSLAPGTYTDTITISAAGATGSPKTVGVTFTVTAPPALSVSPTSLTFTAAYGGSNPASQPVAITNAGGGTLNWSASGTQPWLSLPVAAGTPGNLSVGASIAGLAVGTYTDTITISASGASGSPKTVSVTLTVNPGTSVVFLGLDTTKQGNWRGNYGAEGYQYAGGTSLPSYAQVSVAGGTPYVWSTVTTDARALQNVTGTGRIASAWYGNVMNFDVNLTDGAVHQVELYATDYDDGGRGQRVDILDSGSGAVLDSRTMQNFVAGQYLVWNLTGHVVVRVTLLSGNNAVVSGLFFGSSTAVPPQPPALNLSSASLTFTAVAGSASPASQSVSINNVGGGTLAWGATKTQSWLSLPATSGTAPSVLSVGAILGSLTPGTYTDSVTITAAGATGSPQTIAVSFLVTAAPVLSVSGNSLTFTSVAGGSNPATQSVSITNTGGGTVNWTASGTQPWLTLPVTSGTAPSTLSIGANIASLAPGTYTDTVTITAAGAAGSPKTVAITLNVIAVPVLNVSGTSLTFAAVAGAGNPASQSVSITNTGSGTLNWSAAGTQGWLSLPVTSGAAPSTLSIAVSIAGLAPGTYTDTVTISAVGATGSPKTVGITLTVTAPPTLTLSGSSLTFTAMVGTGNPASQSVSITNTGGGTMSWSASGTQSWLSLPTTSGTAPSDLSIGAILAGLSPGTYTDTVTVSGAGATGSPKTVAITFIVTPPPALSISTTSLTFTSMLSGSDSTPQTVSITNTGGGTLNWTAAKTQSWLSLPAASGTAPSSLSIGTAAAGLALGTYTDTVTITAPGAVGSPKTVSITLIVTSSATFSGMDNTHQGNWKGIYGSNGYTFVGDTPSMPGYVQMSVSGASTYIWTQYSSSPRALQSVNNGTNRVAGVWFTGTVMSFDLNFTDGAAHQLAMYASDYDGAGRAQTVDVLDSASGVVLDTQSMNNFADGRYLLWRVSGHIILRVTRTGGTNAVVNGLFFDPPPPAPLLNVSSTTVTFTGYAGGFNPGTQTVAIANGGGSALSWTASQSAPWLTIGPASGTAPASLSLSVSLSGLALGIYTSNVIISAPGATGSPRTIVVTLNVVVPPPVTLDITPHSLAFSGTAQSANPPSQGVTINNLGGGILNWTATKTQPWLALSSTSGTAPAVLSVGILSAGLAPGTYTDTVTIASPNASIGSPQTIAVTLTLFAPLALPRLDWSFDSSSLSGNVFLDATEYHLDGTINGNVTLVPGVSGQAANFDGSTAYILTRPADPGPAMIGDLTLSLWIKTTNTTRQETVLSKYDINGSEEGYLLQVTPAGYLSLRLGGLNVQGIRDYSDETNKINDGQWHHIAVIIRTNEDVQFYVDGGLSSVFYLTIAMGGTSPPLGVGGPFGSYGNLFTGAIDKLKIWARALTTSEIALLYGSPVNTVAGGEILYNGIALPKNFPPPTMPTQQARTPYYISNPPRVIPIDLGRQLFVDDFLIDQSTLQRVTHQPVMRVNPVLTPGSPISAGAWFEPSSNLYKMWYYDTTPDYRYAYSTDGINWIRPSIPDAMVPNTNEVVSGGDTIWLDLEEANPARRYKSFQVDAGALKIYVYFSPDGIHWGPRNDYGIASLSDRTTVFYNAFRKVWVNSDRGAVGLPATPLRAAQNSRARFYSESKDLLTWVPSNPGVTFWTGPEDTDPPYAGPGGQPPELYNLDAVAYESVLVGLFSWFHPGVGYRDYTLPGPILTEIGVGFSRDGFSWVRPTRGSGPNGAFIPASNIAGTWNAYNTQSVGGGLLTVGDELWFYFSARTLQKPLDGTFSTGLATLRRDGFYSMDAGATEGTLTTRPVRFTGNRMFVNVKDPSGQLRVEVQDANGNVIPGFSASNSSPLSVDKTLQEVTWGGGNLSSLAGQNLKFKFYLTNGSLYSFWVTPSANGASYGYVGAGGPGFTGVTDTVGR